MNDRTELPSQKTHQKTPSGKDPRHIITPDAFTVADDLLGLPLATPKRRAAAMGIDLLVIQQLSHIGSTVLGLSIGVILLLLSRSKGRNAVGTTRKSIFTFMAIALFFYLIATESFHYYKTKEFSLLNNQTQSQVESNDNSEENSLDSLIDSNLPIDEQLSIAHEKIDDLQSENSALRADEDSDIIDLIEAMATKIGYGFGWAGVYFTLFIYLLRGQTPGKFACRIRVIQLDGQRITIWNAFGRYGGYAASVVTGLTGFLQIYWDANRQGLHDKVASTVVIKT